MPTGSVSGISVLDIDADGLTWFDAQHLPLTRMHQTRSGGLHLLFRHAEGLRNSSGVIANGVDVRANGGMVIWWPRQGYEICDAPLAEWPQQFMPTIINAATRGRASLPPTSTSLDVNSVLFKLNPINYRSFDDWLRLMMACCAAGISCEDFVAWSISDPDYANAGEEIRSVWNRIKPDGGVTAATLFRELRGKGEPVHVLPDVMSRRRKLTARDRERLQNIAACVRDEDSLFWAACRYGEARMAVVIKDEVLEDFLMSTAWQCGLRDKDRVRRQIRNGFRAGAGGKWH
jgi:hypothetical protein